MSIHFDFDEAKATAVAALLIGLSRNTLTRADIVTLLYAVDCEALSQWGKPIIGGTYVCGPWDQYITEAWRVSRPSAHSYYAQYIRDAQVIREPGTDDLSAAEIELVERVWHTPLHLLRSYYPGTDAEGVVPYETIMRHAGKSEAAIAAIAADARAVEALKKLPRL